VTNKIGVVGPFTGPRSAYGDLLKQIINQSSLPDYVDILWGDDQGQKLAGEQVAKEFSHQSPLAVLGHFNSDSAYAAAKIYSLHHIPLLLPASTSLLLSELPYVYRICAHDQLQVDALVNFLSAYRKRRFYIWTDESAYSQRLKALLTQRDTGPWFQGPASAMTEDDIVILLGAHHAIAKYLIPLKQSLPTIMALCCDDCAIPEFYLWMKEFKNIWIATPHPGFADCIQTAADLVLGYLQSKSQSSLNDWLNKNSLGFLNGQSRHSYFKLLENKI
jgi:branched-chain amino acid transport system substrate-binding protein